MPNKDLKWAILGILAHTRPVGQSFLRRACSQSLPYTCDAENQSSKKLTAEIWRVGDGFLLFWGQVLLMA
jgi:hypothetical protein